MFFRIWTTAAILLFLNHLSAQNPAPTPAPTPAEIETRFPRPTGLRLRELQRMEPLLAIIQQRIQQFEEHLHKTDPHIARFQAEIDRWRLPATGNALLRFMNAKGDDQQLQDIMRDLRAAYQQIVHVESFDNPDAAEATRRIVLKSLEHQQQLRTMLKLPEDATPDDVFNAYREAIFGRRDEFAKRVKELEDRSGIPRPVLNDIRRAAASKIYVDGTFFPAIELSTPHELKQARRQRDIIVQNIMNSWPGWGEFQRASEALSRFKPRAVGPRIKVASINDRPIFGDELRAPSIDAETEKLAPIILPPLIERAASEQSLAATPDEIALLLKKWARQIDVDITALEKLREQELTQAANEDLDPATRFDHKRSADSHNVYAGLLLFHRDELSDGPKSNDRLGPLWRDHARLVILEWKLSRALHAKWAGKVIPGPNGPFAAEAFMELLEAEEKTRRLQFFDPALRQALFNHISGQGRDGINTPDPFDKPPWQ